MKFFNPNSSLADKIPENFQTALSDSVILLDLSEPIPKDVDLKRCIGLTSGLDPKSIIHFIDDHKLDHIIQLNSPHVPYEIFAAVTMIEKPLSFADDPIGAVLHAFQKEDQKSKPPIKKPNRIFNYKFNSSIEKKATMESLKRYIDKIPKSKTIQDDVMMIADELYTNAVFNAPNKENETKSRNISVHLEQRKPPHLFCSYNEERLIIGVEDPFGSLDPQKIVNRVRACYDNGVARSIQRGVGGAGIGSFTVFDSSTSYYIFVEKNKRTIVASTLPLGVSSRKKEAMTKNIHITMRDV